MIDPGQTAVEGPVVGDFSQVQQHYAETFGQTVHLVSVPAGFAVQLVPTQDGNQVQDTTSGYYTEEFLKARSLEDGDNNNNKQVNKLY